MNSSLKLDVKDKKILIELDNNARKPISQIAKSIRLSKEVTNYRIKNLEKKGIIKGFHTTIDYSKLGFNTYRILLKLKKEPEKKEKLIRHLKKLKSTSFLAKISYEYDLIINLMHKTTQDFFKQYQNIIFKFSDIITKKEVNLVTGIHHFNLPINEKKKTTYITGLSTDITKLSESETLILKEISKNTKATFTDISIRTNKSPNAALYTLKNLQKKDIILGHKPLLDWTKLGLTHYKIFLELENISEKKYKQIIENICQIKNSIFVTEVIAKQDLEFELICKDQLELIRILENLNKEFAEEIKSYRTFTTLKMIAVNYSPF